MKNLFVLKFNK